MTNLLKLEEEIISTFEKHWELNDAAHRIEHFKEVYKTGQEMIIKLRLSMEMKPLLFASYFHDLFAWSRENHHLLSEEFIRGTCHKLICDNLSHDERLLVAGACRKHRASNREHFSNFFEMFFNAADRERPKGVEAMLDRAMKYRESKAPHLSKEQARVDSIRHLVDKYGHGGYASYPEVYTLAFGNSLERQRDQIAELAKEIE